MILLGQDFDVRSYFSENLGSAITNTLPTQEQKDKFQKFIEGKKDIKKEDLKDI